MRKKMSNIEKIRQEIERRKKELTPHKGQGVILCREIIKQFDSLLSFIDTISQPIMKDDIINEIRSEIERRFSEYNHDSNHHIQAAECASILAFIDSLPEEKRSEDLEEEIKNYFEGLWPGIETAEQCNTDLHFTPLAIMRLASHFAEWGAKHQLFLP